MWLGRETNLVLLDTLRSACFVRSDCVFESNVMRADLRSHTENKYKVRGDDDNDGGDDNDVDKYFHFIRAAILKMPRAPP